MAVLQLCTFRVASLDFAVDVRHVQEVLRPQDLTRVPLAPHALHGLINLRGQIVSAIDMRDRLGLPSREEDDDPPFNVVVHSTSGIVSLLVDSIGDVIDVDDTMVGSNPETLDARTLEVVNGVLKLESQLVLLISADAVTTVHTHRKEAS